MRTSDGNTSGSGASPEFEWMEVQPGYEIGVLERVERFLSELESILNAHQ